MSMDRGTWWATVHGVTRVGHDLVTKPPPEFAITGFNNLNQLSVGNRYLKLYVENNSSLISGSSGLT